MSVELESLLLTQAPDVRRQPCVRLSRRDESFVIVSGAVTIELTDSGETVELQRGDVASFPNGTPSVWTVVEPLEKFTVVSG